jgi:hypothetical protein
MAGGSPVSSEARVLDVRADRPVCTPATTIRTADGIVVVDGTAVVWRDPLVAREAGERRPERPAPMTEETVR